MTYYICNECCQEVAGPDSICRCQEIKALKEEVTTLRTRAESAERESRLLRQQLEGETEAYTLSDKIATERMHKAERDRDGIKAAVVTDIIEQARCLSSMIDPVMGDMYCRGWRRALETLEKSVMALK